MFSNLRATVLGVTPSIHPREGEVLESVGAHSRRAVYLLAVLQLFFFGERLRSITAVPPPVATRILVKRAEYTHETPNKALELTELPVGKLSDFRPSGDT